MPSMSEIIAEQTELSDDDHHWLRLLVAEWQLLADLSFSDLVLWVPDRDPNVFWAAAQLRPTTGPTSLFDDVVGDLIAYSPEHLVSGAFVSGEMTQTSDGNLQAGLPVDTHAIPVKLDGRVIAVVEQLTSMLGVRAPSSLEQAYLAAAAQLARMITVGAFPMPGDVADLAFSPRVGDGFIRIDAAGEVEYASPNALSAYRRLGLIGDLVDEHLAGVTAQFFPTGPGPVDDSVQSVLSGRIARRAELVSGEAHLMVRVLPLLEGRERLGAVVLCRDVSDLRSKERQLVTKDATIREIHHRVKNNLQTVAALLRMQARRIESRRGPGGAHRRGVPGRLDRDRARDAVPGLRRDRRIRQGGRRPAADGGRRRRVLGRGLGPPAGQFRAGLGRDRDRPGDGDHRALPERRRARARRRAGQVLVVPTRLDGRLRIEISDDGRGLPPDFDWRQSRSLGLSIVNTLVAEMEGVFRVGSQPDGPGTRAVVEIPLERRDA